MRLSLAAVVIAGFAPALAAQATFATYTGDARNTVVVQDAGAGGGINNPLYLPPAADNNYSGVVNLWFRDATGAVRSGCTGSLLATRKILTAGHCVYNIANDQWYSALSFSPGQNGASSPYGKINWSRALSVKGWTTDHKRDYDYAMIVLSQDIGNTVGWMGYGWKNPLPAYNININGYPGDKPSGTMWHAFCALQIIQTYRLYYACDTAGGMSGSATYVYFTNDGKRTIYGIHAYGVSDSTQLNGATRIREEVYNNLKNWKATY